MAAIWLFVTGYLLTRTLFSAFATARQALLQRVPLENHIRDDALVASGAEAADGRGSRGEHGLRPRISSCANSWQYGRVATWAGLAGRLRRL